MDCNKPRISKKNPRERASIFSIIFFKYVFTDFITGARRNLEINDIYDVLPSHQANCLYQHMNEEWEKEKRKPKPSIFFIFLRMFGIEFVLWGAGILFVGLCFHDFLHSILIGKLMRFFEPGQNVTLEEASLYATATIGSMLTMILFDNVYLLAVWLIGLKMQIACCTMVYRKCLKLNLGINSENNNGKAVTIMTKDVMQLLMVADCGHMLIMGFPRFLVMLYIMYRYIGVTAFVGAAFVFLMIPVNAYFGILTTNYRLKTASRTDARLKITQEILTAIRIVKMYTWENFFSKKIDKLRSYEVQHLRTLFYVKAIVLSIGQLSSRFAFYACVMTYIALGNHITAEKAFAVTGCFGSITAVLTDFMPIGIAQMAEYKASLQRITDFLMLEEVPQIEIQNNSNVKGDIKVSVCNATVQGENGITVLDKINLEISKGLTVIMGPTGAGKSVLLKLLLGDMSRANGKVNVRGKRSYASQEPWIFPSTVRQNIIFAENFEAERYNKVLEVCALKLDMEMLPNGDQTCLTDRGLNLSKGQKARINLARAIYKKADIYLLDDCLSSVDSRVGQHIFTKCIKEFLKESICILVTHNLLTLDSGDNILILNKGSLKFHDIFSNFKEWDAHESVIQTTPKELEYISKHNIDIISDSDQNETSALLQQDSQITNIYEEFNEVGKVKNYVYYDYFRAGGGWKFFVMVAFFSIVAHVTASWSDYFVSFWVDMEQELTGFRLNQTTNSTEYEELEKSHENVMTLYSFVMLAAAIFAIVRAFTFFIFTSKASTGIHNSIMQRIINTGISFFDKNLSGNVLNRLSRDLGMIDEYLPLVLFECSRVFLSIFAVMFVVSSVNWYFVIPSTLFIILLYFSRHWYMPTGRNLRRLAGAARSPLIGHLNATFEGLTTIRACEAEGILENEFDNHQNLFSSALFMNLTTMRAFGFYTDMLGSLYIIIITFSFLFFKTDTLAGKVGLAITQSFSLTGLLKWGIIEWAELENLMTSTERVLNYKNLEVEDKSGRTIDNWPNNGRIEYQNVSLRYSIENKRILKDLSFYIESKEKIGVVGRTGAGKTSIISTMFRMYEYVGVILIDGIDIKSIAINCLRSKISIIPQDPVLFSGTVKSNLDPYSQYSDKHLWDALNEVELKHCFKSLDDAIVEGGIEMSVGQKQLLCLARAVVHNNDILILDEATANIDPETDAFIQRTIKRRFDNCTIITIAHRLPTVINSDKIIVIDAGRIVQFGPPRILLEDKDSLFYNMVKQSGLKI